MQKKQFGRARETSMIVSRIPTIEKSSFSFCFSTQPKDLQETMRRQRIIYSRNAEFLFEQNKFVQIYFYRFSFSDICEQRIHFSF